MRWPRGDEFLSDVAGGRADGPDDPDAIRYRQRVLADCLEHPDVDPASSTRSTVEALRERARRRLAPGPRLARLGSSTGPCGVLELLRRFLAAAAPIADEHRDRSARRGSRASSRCSAASSTTSTSRTVEAPSERARVQARRARSAPSSAGATRARSLLAAPAAPAGLAERISHAAGPRLQLPDPGPGRERMQGARRAARQGDQPRRQRPRAVGRPHPQLLQRCCERSSASTSAA